VTQRAWLRLSQLNRLIKGALDAWSGNYGDVLVVAEVAEIRCGATGHYYAKLVERRGEGVVAELDAVVWSRYVRTLDEFRAATGTPVAPGMEILLRGRVTYHERYGLKLEITEVDPTYTLGEMQRQRRETIARLVAEGLMERNRHLAVPLVPQRIAVVASTGSAGYQDFVDQLLRNPYGYAFQHTAFNAVVQGDQAEKSLSDAFARLARVGGSFDVAVLVRGGGSQVDLSAFDTYGAAAAIACCPVPVLTGIGHERDETVADMVAHTRAKTPTAAAEVIVGIVREFEERLEEAWTLLVSTARESLGALPDRLTSLARELDGAARRTGACERERLGSAVTALAGRTLARLRWHADVLGAQARRFGNTARAPYSRAGADLQSSAVRLRVVARSALAGDEIRLDSRARGLEHLDPARVLARGFSVTRYEGRAIRAPGAVPVGAAICTTLAGGAIVSRVESKEVVGEEGDTDLRSGS